MSRRLKIFRHFVRDHGRGNVHQFHTSSPHVLKIALTNDDLTINMTNPRFGTNVADLATGSGYTTGGRSIGALVEASLAASGDWKFYGSTNPSWTAPANADIGPWRYAVLYNDTATDKPCIGFWDYGINKYIRRGTTFSIAVTQSTSIGLLIFTSRFGK